MCLHTAAICLHQAAIFKADKNCMPQNIATESKMRCMSAASEIAGIMRLSSHLDLGTVGPLCPRSIVLWAKDYQMHPFLPFCLYVASRVFVQYLRVKSDDQQITASLHFLLSAMHAMKRVNSLTESFLAQLEVDLESAGLANPNSESSLEHLLKDRLV